MNKKPTISVVLPVSGTVDSMKKAAESILGQTFPDWELLLIDGGSAKGYDEYCRELTTGDRRARSVHTEEGGTAHARNAGISAAEGEWIAFLNAGEVYTENAFEKMMECAEKADVVSSTQMKLPWIYPPDLHNSEAWMVQTSGQESIKLLKEGCLRSICGKLYRRSQLCALFDVETRSMEEYLFNTANLPGFHTVRVVPFIGYIANGDEESSGYSISDMNYPIVCRKIRSNLIRELPFPEVVSWANREFVKTLIYYIYYFVNSDFGATDVEKVMILQILQEETMTPEIRQIDVKKLQEIEKENWEILCAGSPEEIFAKFSKEAYGLRTEKYSPVQAKQPGERVIKGIPLRSFKIKIAGIPMEVLHRYDLIKEACKEYLIPEDTQAAVSFMTTEERMQFSKDYVKKETGNDISDDAAELDATHFNLYGKLTEFDAFWLHSVIVEREGKGYAFTAKPETGKSTHGKLWLKAFPDARIINGDNAIIRRQPDGTFFAYGTPFCGKEGYNVNTGVPLKGICFLSRGKENKIRPLDPDFAVNCLCRDNFCIVPENAEAHWKLYRQLTKQVPCYVLECNMDVEAAHVAWQGMNSVDAR